METKKEKIQASVADGYITVYLSLILGILMAFVCTMLIGARSRTIEFASECITDVSLNSALAEYNREMLDRFKLFFVDCAYGQQEGDISNTERHILQYMNLNFDKQGDVRIPLYKNLIASTADNCTLSDVTLASDESGEVLRYQINRYMKAKYNLDIIKSGSHDAERLGQLKEEYDGRAGERENYHGQVDEIMSELNAALEEGQEPYSISNPAEAVGVASAGRILTYAIADINSMEWNSIGGYYSNIASNRKLKSGEGLKSYQPKAAGVGEELMFREYLFSNLGFYRSEKPDTCLKSQIEYLLAGEASDLANMKKVAEEIFMIRYSVNMSYLLSSDLRKGEAEALALAACAIIQQPQLIEAVKYTILFAWGYAESAKDMRIIYDGHGLSLTKTDADWNTPLSQMVDFEAYLGEYAVPSGNMDYKAYLEGLLLLRSRKELSLRLMDIYEMDIRRTPGNGNFQIDNCIYQFDAEINIRSRYGHSCSIKRFATYE